MNENFHKEGYYLTVQNAENLFAIANLSAQSGYYGNACAINILAIEELKKPLRQHL